MLHLGGQTFHGTRDSHSSRRSRRSAQHCRELVVRVQHFETADDGFPVLGVQPLQRYFVPFEVLCTDRGFKR